MAMWHVWRKTKYIQSFGGKPVGKRSLGTPRRKWEDNIKIDLKEMGWKIVDWTDLFQNGDRRRAVMNRVIYFGIFIKMRGNFL